MAWDDPERELDRAWRYHAAADELLHSRVEALLIAQAFLVLGYAQVLTAERFCERSDLPLALLILVVMALALTLIMMFVNAGLSRGIRRLKADYLDHKDAGDPVYARYLAAVRGDRGGRRRAFPRLWSFWMPAIFLVFWAAAGGHATALVAGALSCEGWTL